MNHYYQRMEDKFSVLSIREQLLIGITLFAVTWGLWIATIGGAVIDNKVDVISDIDRLSIELQNQSNERQRLLSEDAVSGRDSMVARQNRLKGLLLEQQLELDDLLSRFVPPEEIPVLLEDVLDDFGGLKLVRLASQPAEPLLISTLDETEQPPSETSEQDGIQVYRHPVRMEFEGGYQDVVAYLDALEAANWKFSWRKLEYVVKEHPTAQVTIELETLSREKEWLGV